MIDAKLVCGVFDEPIVNKKWVESILTNDETSSDQDLVFHFFINGLSYEQAEFFVSQRERALKNPLTFKLETIGA